MNFDYKSGWLFLGNIFLFFLFIGVLGCAKKEKPYQRESAIFNKYLKSIRSPLNINMNGVFILVPYRTCLGCKAATFNFFDTVKAENIYLLSSDPEIITQFSKYKERIYFDSTENLDRLDLPLPNIIALQYKSGTVTDLKTFNSEAPDSIFMYIEKWIHY